MKIKMLETTAGSPDGVTVNTYQAGQEYMLPDSLAEVFINQMLVAEVIAEDKIQEIEVSEPAEIETPDPVEIETPEMLIEIEQPMKTIKRKPGRPKRTNK